MEDELGRFVIETWGPLYVIGGAVTIGVVAAILAWKVHEGSTFLAFCLGAVAVVAAIVAASGLPAAKAACTNQFMAESAAQISARVGPYYAHHCDKITICIAPLGSIRGSCG